MAARTAELGGVVSWGEVSLIPKSSESCKVSGVGHVSPLLQIRQIRTP